MPSWWLSHSSRTPRILVALSRALAERRYDVRTAPDGLSGLSDIVDRRPDFVILDLGLPDIDGLDLLQMLRAVSQVPVIVATARHDEAEIIRTLDAEADDYYLVKSFSAE